MSNKRLGPMLARNTAQIYVYVPVGGQPQWFNMINLIKSSHRTQKTLAYTLDPKTLRNY